MQNREFINIYFLNAVSRPNNMEKVHELVEKGADVNYLCEWAPPALTQAVCFNNSEMVKYLIDKKADVNLPDSKGLIPLMVADAKMITLLLEHNANINQLDNNNETALISAARNGYTEAVDKLLEHGADMRLCNKDGKTAHTIAIENGHMEIADKIKEIEKNYRETKKIIEELFIPKFQERPVLKIQKPYEIIELKPAVSKNGLFASINEMLPLPRSIVDIIDGYIKPQV